MHEVSHVIKKVLHHSKNIAAFQMQITLLLSSLDTGLYHNKVTFSLTPNHRLGNKVHNYTMAY